MLWSRAKTILIVFLLCTNIFLLCILLTSHYKRTRVPDGIISSAVELLSKRGIEIDARLIPKTAGSAKQYTVENVIKSYEEFAKTALGEGGEPFEGGFKTDDARISFSGDIFKIEYASGVQTSDKLRSPAEKVRVHLKGLGIDASDAEVKVSNDSAGIFTVTFTKRLAEAELLDCRVSVCLDGERIISAEGCWFDNASAGAAYDLESAPGLLVGFAASGRMNPGGRITAMEFGYCVNEDGVYHMQSTVVPVYALTTDDGRSFFVDARSK